MATNKPPAVVIIARHGARLDAADKQWHLTSPTPYDPPLTYGGWSQARALGARIATVLQAREDEAAAISGTERGRGRKKHKVIIHSSPFVRCVQTGIAISAGIAQYQNSSASTHLGKSSLLRSSSQRRARDGSPGLPSIPEPTGDIASTTSNAIGAPQKLRVTRLRIDAFLGEWLSPDYFEDITPPPSSVMMVASAKAELLRPGEKIEGTDLGDKAQGNFPGGWKAGASDVSSIEEADEEPTGLGDMSSLANALPRSRSNTVTPESRPKPRISTNVNSSGATYVPPTPTYAIAPSDPIPAGYVAHARDACVDVDYRWDSMRQPQDWGNGGEYGEEWSSMHKRFRNGLQKMIGWYKDQPLLDDKDVETVLILVTHGAGCNALIGALTNQPVLLDVAMASMTLASRRETPNSAEVRESTNSRQSRRSSIADQTLSEEYDVKMMASTEHLRGGSTPMSPAVGQSPRSATSAWRRTSSSAEWKFEDTRPATSQGVPRSSSVSSRSHAATLPFKPSGLWGSSTPTETTTEPSDLDLMPNFGEASPLPVQALGEEAVKVVEVTNGETTNGEVKSGIWQPPSRTASQRGLWGGGALLRDPQPKRRWTVNEQ